MTSPHDIEKDGRPFRDIWTPTKESGEKRVTDPVQVEVITDPQPADFKRLFPAWAENVTLDEAQVMLRAVHEVIARRAAEIDPAAREELERSTPEGFKPYPVAVDPSGRVFQPASGWVVDVNVFTERELRNALERADHMGDVLDHFGARWLAPELRPQTED